MHLCAIYLVSRWDLEGKTGVLNQFMMDGQICVTSEI